MLYDTGTLLVLLDKPNAGFCALLADHQSQGYTDRRVDFLWYVFSADTLRLGANRARDVEYYDYSARYRGGAGQSDLLESGLPEENCVSSDPGHVHYVCI